MADSNGIYLSVIIPAYNEEERLPATLEKVEGYLSRQGYSYEIVVVSDGSTDRTPDIVRERMEENKHLKLIEFKNRLGKGQGVKKGMLSARGNFRVFTDADNSTPIHQVEKMWPWFKKGYDVVIGSRDVKGAVLDPPQPWIRKVFLGAGFKFYRKIVLGLWGLEDTQCGFKGFSRKSVEDVFPHLRIRGFAFDPEVLIIAREKGYKIKEFPVYWKNDPDSKVKLKNMIKMAIDLLEIRWNLIVRKYAR